MRLYFPEWQGYASDDGSRRGAELIRERACGPSEFAEIEVDSDAALISEQGIVGRAAVVRNTGRVSRSCAGTSPGGSSLSGGPVGSSSGPCRT